MTGFSADWLALREAADHRARNSDLADGLQARFAQRDTVNVVDIGCGSGSNLRGTAPLLPSRQSWTLVDYDADLLSAARGELQKWADASEGHGESLRLRKDRLDIEVSFRQADLAADLETALGTGADLITAAAFFDLTSPAFIKTFTRAVAARRAVFYTVLTYNGLSGWDPRNPSDNAISSAVNRHQGTDKGFGPAAGPTAASHLADQFRLNDYIVSEGDSPWRLGSADQALIDELVAGHVRAVSETGAVDAATIEKWGKVVRKGAMVGHTDTLAVPG